MRLSTSNRDRYWAAVWKGANGRRKSKNLGPTATMSRREATERMQLLIGQHALHPATKGAEVGTRLFAWCERYTALRTDLEPGSMDLLKRSCALLREHFSQDPRLDRIAVPLAQDYRLWLEDRPGRRENGLSAATIAMHLRNTRAIMSAAVRDGLLGSNPFASVRSIKGGRVRGFHEVTLDEFDRLLEVLPDHHWRCFVSLMRLAGLRSGWRGGEALGMTWDRIDWARHMMTVEDVKRHVQRCVPIQEHLFTILRAAFEAAEQGQVLVCPVPRSSLDRKLRRYIQMAGIDPYPKAAHAMRKSLQSQWLSEFPAPAVNEWLGNSARVSQEHYWQPPIALLATVTGLSRTELRKQRRESSTQRTESEPDGS